MKFNISVPILFIKILINFINNYKIRIYCKMLNNFIDNRYERM